MELKNSICVHRLFGPNRRRVLFGRHRVCVTAKHDKSPSTSQISLLAPPTTALPRLFSWCVLLNFGTEHMCVIHTDRDAQESYTRTQTLQVRHTGHARGAGVCPASVAPRPREVSKRAILDQPAPHTRACVPYRYVCLCICAWMREKERERERWCLGERENMRVC